MLAQKQWSPGSRPNYECRDCVKGDNSEYGMTECLKDYSSLFSLFSYLSESFTLQWKSNVFEIHLPYVPIHFSMKTIHPFYPIRQEFIILGEKTLGWLK